MRRTHYQPLQKVERIYKNSLPAIRLLVKRREFETLDELTDLVSHIESTRGPIGPKNPMTTLEVTRNLQSRPDHGHKETPARAQPTNGNPAPASVRLTQEKPNASNPPEFIKNPKTACRKCAEQGHSADSCKHATRYFCWQCGKVGILTKDCCPTNKAKLNIVYAHNTKPPTETTTLKMSPPEYRDQTIRCQITVGSQTYWAIMDTGSFYSYVDERVATTLPPTSYVQEPCMFDVTMATGSQSQVTSALNVRLGFQDQLVAIKVLRLKDCTENFILAIDFLERIGTTIFFGQNPNVLRISPRSNRLEAYQTETADGKLPNNPSTEGTTQVPEPKLPNEDKASQTRLPSPPGGIIDEDWLNDQDILEISTDWHDEVLMTPENEASTGDADTQPVTRVELSPRVKVYPYPSNTAATSNIETTSFNKLNHPPSYKRSSPTGSIRGRTVRANEPEVRITPPYPTRTRPEGMYEYSSPRFKIPEPKPDEEQFDPPNEDTWPESLRQKVKNIKQRIQAGEKFSRRGELHFDQDVRYRLLVKYDGTLRVGKLPPRADQ